MSAAPRVLIVEDHPLFRDALETALMRAVPGTPSTRHAASLSDALAAIGNSTFELILLDLNLADSEGFEGLSKIRAANSQCAIVVISALETMTAYSKAKTLGAAGYLPKSMPLEDLSAGLATVLDGGEWFPAGVSHAESDSAIRVSNLTPAQRRVLDGLSDGLLNKQIAYEMDISVATVKAHMTAIFRKLGANNRTQALLIYKSAMSAGDHSAA
ncbi:MAG: response regulator transcription factor [Pseudomonadota bacterium]